MRAPLAEGKDEIEQWRVDMRRMESILERNDGRIVVDIQTTAPEKFSMPAITFCNVNGIIPKKFCYLGVPCIPVRFVKYVINCNNWIQMCEKLGYKLPVDLLPIPYQKALRQNTFSSSLLKSLKKPIAEFFRCKIVSSAGERNCTIDDVLIGSHYSDSDFFGICYTMNSRWTQPNITVEEIKRSDKIEIEFYVDLDDRHLNVSMDTVVRPKYNYPSLVVMQLGLHNNYASLSPYQNGVELLGGKQYEINLKKEVKHLLPAPYQTNCTDYITMWKHRGGVGPLNPIMAMEECKYNFSLQEYGCVPFTVDYPHNDSVCKVCDECFNMTYIESLCEKLLGKYNQPCEYISYSMKMEEKYILIRKQMASTNVPYVNRYIAILNEGAVHERRTSPWRLNLQLMTIRYKSNRHNCIKTAVFTRRCQTIHVDILFNDFEITTSSYKPKLESLELLSIIGSYMGIYLGISMVSVSWLFEMALSFADRFLKKPGKRVRKIEKNKPVYDGRRILFLLSRGLRRRNRVFDFNM
ncbi:uncharacterized protein NPIL_25401 [Nephila pilipes]|uniref:Uncharacterized protein n=1 Tax=Nephila pilipes TaxID=299642 RepID=A0A8X6US87_NEPPI|nr:uncharacterized protein NPIL_25401 [Nephila pilipes]